VFCRTCRGPAGARFARCYQCELALRQAGRLLADVVAPIGYAVRGGPLADDLRVYKSDWAAAAEAAAAAERLRELFAAFLAGHGESVWSAAGMSAGPTAVAVVPSGQGRPGEHPLAGIVRSCVGLPPVRLAVEPKQGHGRGVDPDWLRVGDPVSGADVLLVDDTWVSGGSAQSTAAALKLAGAGHVAVVVLGRHVNPADPRSAGFLERTPAAAGGPGGVAWTSAWPARGQSAESRGETSPRAVPPCRAASS